MPQCINRARRHIERVYANSGETWSEMDILCSHKLPSSKTSQDHGVIGNGVTVTGTKLLPSLAPLVCYR
jgi:hypothetical protein